MKLTLRIWRQKDAKSAGKIETYETPDFSSHASFLEMLDIVNEKLINEGQEPIAFDHDCREGICGACSLVINGIPHGPMTETTTCQLHMRHFNDGETVTIEPWRAKAFPIVRDLVVDRSAFDRIMAAGGYVSVNTGGTPDANAMPISRDEADIAMDAAQCIGCGACVATCKNAAAMLFVSAKVAQFAHLPQGQPERKRRVLNMVEQMEEEGFGTCTNTYDCEAACPKGVPVRFIAEMNRDFLKASIAD
jgi:succinate dehydrogenase / fumarate reductase iron-sulfur subunit